MHIDVINLRFMLQGAIIVGLQNRFKEFRRERKPRSSPAKVLEPKIPAKQKSPAKRPAKQLMQRPEIAAGEDLGSYERFTKTIREEFRRRSPRADVYIPLIETTYAHRRLEILDSQILVSDVLEKHPFLSQEDQVGLRIKT